MQLASFRLERCTLGFRGVREVGPIDIRQSAHDGGLLAHQCSHALMDLCSATQFGRRRGDSRMTDREQEEKDKASNEPAERQLPSASVAA